MQYTTGPMTMVTIASLIVAVGLFARDLPRRERFGLRLAVVAVAAVALTVLGLRMGFSIFPELTDQASFLTAIATFALVLAILVVGTLVVFDCSGWVALFCCSMGYLVQSMSGSVERASTLLFPHGSYPPSLVEGASRAIIVTAIVYVTVYLLLAKKLEREGLLLIDDSIAVVIAAFAIVVNMVFDLVTKDLAVLDIPAHYNSALVLVYLFMCSFTLYASYEIVYNRRLLQNMATMQRMREVEAKQYELSRENIDAINRKCHDIRHQIRHYSGGAAQVDRQVLEDIGREVDVYDSVVKSGNDALDTILTEKSLFCEAHGISLACIADGSALDFMRPVDLYSLFGNALDNATEAVLKLDDPEMRDISLDVRRNHGLVSIHVENYFDGKLELGADGLPRTSKGDSQNHGFGTRSMRHVVESYGGNLTTSVMDDVFVLDAVIPAA